MQTPADAPRPAVTEAPAVSVIMNCLNSSRHLREALDSLMAQTFTDFEVIFWDNASTDASPAIAQSYGPKVRYFRGETIVPLGAGRNLALAQARGRYLAFLDCDDLWRPEKLAAQTALFEVNPRVGLACTDTEIFDGRGMRRRLFAEAAPVRGKAFAALMERQWISMSSAMIRKSALDSLGEWFDESLNVCEEADVFYRIAKTWELDHVDEPLTRWRVHGVNTTFRKFGQFADETLRILDKHRKLYPGYDRDYPDLVGILTRRAAFQKAVTLWREGNGAEARRLVAPYVASPKLRLFWLASWLPGSLFDPLSQLYFKLPGFLRK